MSFVESIVIALVLSVVMTPLVVVMWRATDRPVLCLEPGGIRVFRGRLARIALPREEIASFEVREERINRWVVARMTKGVDIPLDLLVDIQVPLLRDYSFDERVARLEEWRRGPGTAF